jgi:hypothetical protein
VAAWVHQDGGLGAHDFIDVFFKALSELRRNLVQTADQGVAECWV